MSSEPPTGDAPRGSEELRGSEEPRGMAAWMPAVIALSAVALMILFIACGIGTYLLFQKRSELAGRTLQQTLVPLVEQSNLAPEEKAAVVVQLERLAREAESGELENWQAAGVMQRLIQVPLLEWGDLDAALATVQERGDWTEEEQARAALAVSRVKRAVELGEVTTTDLQRALEPLMQPSDTLRGESLDLRAEKSRFEDVFHRCKLLADRAEVPERTFEVSLVDIVRRQIEAGRREGAK